MAKDKSFDSTLPLTLFPVESVGQGSVVISDKEEGQFQPLDTSRGDSWGSESRGPEAVVAVHGYT